MKRISWKDSAELIGNAAIVASLIFVGLQLKQDRELVNAEVTTAVIGSIPDLVELINSNPEVWMRGLDGEELSPPNEMAFGWMTRILYHHLRFRRSRIQVWGGSGKIAIQDYAFYMYQYPGLKRAFDEYSAQIELRENALGQTSVTSYRILVHSAYEDLIERAPPVPPKDYILF
jgi:hypothetical protein